MLGLWCSGGADVVNNELAALKSAISTYGTSFTSRVVGISVGSEDLYRDSITGQQAEAGVGAGPDTILSYINQVKTAVSGTGILIGHVDTWTAWVNSSNTEVIDALDWIGFDAYPYFQNTQSNGIENGKSLFLEAMDNTVGAVGSKPVWVTETGWPVSGKTENLGVPSPANAQIYWNDVACPLLGNTNTWWYTIEDNDNATPNPSFGVTNGNPLSTTPYYDLSCSNVTSSSSTSSSASASASGSSSVSSASGSASASASAVVSSGSGLSPTGAGNGQASASVTTTAAGETVTVVSGGSTGSGAGNSSVTTGSLKPSSTGSGSQSSSTSTAPLNIASGTNAGNVVSGSLVGVVGAAIAVLVAAL